MTEILQRALELEASAQTHEQSAAWHLDQAGEAREYASLYRDLAHAIETDDLRLARDRAGMLGLELRIPRDGAIEVVGWCDEVVEEAGAQHVAVAARRGR